MAKKKVEQDAGTKAFQSVDERIAALCESLDVLLAEGDQGDGVFTHLLAARARLEGVRDAQRAWEHQTESPLSAGAARDEELAASVGAA